MSIRQRDALMSGLGGLRHEPTAKRIRATISGVTVVDSVRAVLVWEPRRVVASYAVPATDVAGELVPAPMTGAGGVTGLGSSMPDISRRPVLDPSIPFAVHTAAGEPVDVVTGGARRSGAGFRLADPDLSGYVVLDFSAFDAWFEEDEPNVAHPRDPFHRIDVVASSRHVVVTLDGEVVAESSRPTILFETTLPPRYYLPREDVRVALVPSPTVTWCAYKGRASYWTAGLAAGAVADVAWTYSDPLHEAAGIRDLVAFFDERVDVTLDGERRERPVTPWSQPGHGARPS